MEVKIMEMTMVDAMEDLVMKIRNVIQPMKQKTTKHVYVILKRFIVQPEKRNSEMCRWVNVYEKVPAVFNVRKCHKVTEHVCDTVYETTLTKKDDFECI